VVTRTECSVEWGVVFDCDADDADQLVEFFGEGVSGGGLAGLGSHFSATGE
jgi:hypothetical protein